MIETLYHPLRSESIVAADPFAITQPIAAFHTFYICILTVSVDILSVW